MVRISRNRMDMEDGRIDQAVIRDYGETLVGGSDGTNTGSTYALDIAQGNVFHLILNTNCTFSISNAPPLGTSATITLLLKQDSTGSRLAGWPASVVWLAGTAPTLTTTASRYDIITLTTMTAGSVWYGSAPAQDYELPPQLELWSWGNGFHGGTGLENTASISSPAQVGSLTDWSSIVSGNHHVLGIKTDGSLWAWGRGLTGRTGLDTILNVSSPTQVGSLTNWASVAAVSTTLAIKTDGTLWAWSSGYNGGTGLNDTVTRSSPTQVGSGTDWASVASGGSHALAIKTNGTLWAWGSADTFGQTGLNSLINRSSPIQVGAATDWASIASGLYHAIAIKTTGTLWAWGRNFNGVTGLNSTAHRSSPAQVGAATNWASVSTNNHHAIAVKADGSLWAWGLQTSGQTGLNTAGYRSSPTQVGSLTDWASVSAADTHSNAIKTDGTLWAWGSGSGSALDTFAATSSPTQVGTGTNWTSVTGGTNISIALRREL